MKKFLIPATIVAMMGVGGYFGRQALNNTLSGMSDLELANAEALSDPEAWVEVKYDKGCDSTPGEGCAINPYQYYPFDTPYN